MTKIIRAEFYKLSKSLAPWGISLGYFLLCSILVGDHSDMVGYMRSSLYPVPFMVFMHTALAIFMIGHEFDQRLLQSYVASGNKRTHIFFGKLISYLTVSMGMTIATLLIHCLMGLVTRGEVIEWETILFLIPSFLGICMLPAFLAFVFKDIGKTLGSGLVFYCIMMISLNTQGLSSKAVYLPYGHPILVYADQLIPSGRPLLLLIDLIWIAVLVTGSFIAFRRSDLK